MLKSKFKRAKLYQADDASIELDSIKQDSLQKKKTHKHLSGCTCSDCDKSPGEKRIENWLIDHSRPYTREHRIKECRNVLPLPFDFAVFNDKEKHSLKLLIEFDGAQHYQEMGGIYKGKFDEIKRHDQIKTDYCKGKGIRLLRIHYKSIDSIDEILDKEII